MQTTRDGIADSSGCGNLARRHVPWIDTRLIDKGLSTFAGTWVRSRIANPVLTLS